MFQLYAKVSPGILQEIPRFFTGINSILAEIFANAYRAGATSVFVTYDPEANTLVIDDNGRGLADPQLLLTAGESGWDEDIVDPAGMGAFSALRTEIIEKVIYCNHGDPAWEMEVTPGVLEGAPASVQPIGASSSGMKVTPGMKVTLHLRPGQEITREKVRSARARYPFKVYYTDDTSMATPPEEMLPYTLWEHVFAIDTPVGRLEWSGNPNYIPNSSNWNKPTVVWEHREFISPNFRAALEKAVKGSSAPALLDTLIVKGSVRWIVDPACGVKPKLPDRTDLLVDDQLTEAVQVIISMLPARLIEEMRQEAEQWPDEIEMNYSSCNIELGAVSKSALTSYYNRNDQEVILAALGWYVVVWSDFEEFYTYRSGNELELERSHRMVIYRNSPLRVNCRAAALTLNSQGTPAIYDPEGVPVTIEGLQVSEKSPWVARADKIMVGDTEIPYLVSEDFDSSRNGPNWYEIPGWEQFPCDLTVICAGSAQDCLNAIDEQWIANAIVQAAADQYWSQAWESDDGSIDYDEICEELGVQILQAFQPEIADDRQEMFRLQEERNQLAEIQRTLQAMVKRYQAQPEDPLAKTVKGLAGKVAKTLGVIDDRGQELDRRTSPPGTKQWRIWA